MEHTDQEENVSSGMEQKDQEEFERLVHAFEECVTINPKGICKGATHKYRAFFGKDAVAALVAKGVAKDVDDAVAIGNRLMEKGLFASVGKKKEDFKNETLFYRYVHDDHTHYNDLVATLPPQTGKVIAITGCTSGTGLIAAKSCASLGATLILLNRPSTRAEAALAQVTTMCRQGASVVHVDCDLMNSASVNAAADRILAEYAESGIDVLALNAGIMGTDDKPTAEGYDAQMQVDHLSQFLLGARLYPLLQKAASTRDEARIVCQTSTARFGKKLDAKYLSKHTEAGLGGNSFAAGQERYHQTKLANAVFIQALHDKLSASGSRVKAAYSHPGAAKTSLFTNSPSVGGLLLKFINMSFQSAEDGTCGLMTCMCSPGVKSGEFWSCGEKATSMKGKAILCKPTENETDPESKKMLWEASVNYAGCDFDFSERE